mgnify:CR=1 FL=1
MTVLLRVSAPFRFRQTGWLTALVLMTFLAGCGEDPAPVPTEVAAPREADLILINGRVYTLDWEEPATDGTAASGAPRDPASFQTARISSGSPSTASPSNLSTVERIERIRSMTVPVLVIAGDADADLLRDRLVVVGVSGGELLRRMTVVAAHRDRTRFQHRVVLAAVPVDLPRAVTVLALHAGGAMNVGQIQAQAIACLAGCTFRGQP